MTEFELKFEVPAASLQGVRDAMLQGESNRPLNKQRLQASYFDTPDGALASRGIVVRLRKEGRHWVQTAKGPTADVLERLEHNAAVPTPASGANPALDLTRHDGTPIGKAIAAALKRRSDKTSRSLSLIYGTDVKRTARRVTYNHSVVEIALDEGRVFSDSASQAICELELELRTGSALDVVRLAQRWRSTHGLWLSTIAKSMKGQRLGQASGYRAATSGPALAYAPDASADEMVTAVVAACLAQILPNMSELADCSGSGVKRGSGSGSENSEPEHIHQLRVGIRRLRTALRELGDLTDAIDPTDPRWESALVSAFRALGAHRDQSNLYEVLQPQLAAAGGPDLRPLTAEVSLFSSQEMARAADFQDALLGLLAFVHRALPPPSAQASRLKKTMSRRLNKLYKKTLDDGKKFSALDDVQQHGVRKRLKRLRYLIEFTAPLFTSRQVNRMVTALKPVQDALGLYNDELMALHALQALAADDPKALFGVGWLTARQPAHVEQCVKEIRKFAAVKSFWRN